jgi:hypothetical protein
MRPFQFRAAAARRHNYFILTPNKRMFEMTRHNSKFIISAAAIAVMAALSQTAFAADAKSKVAEKLDQTTTQSIPLSNECLNTQPSSEDAFTCNTALNSDAMSSKYPVNALQGLNLGF